MEDSENLVGSLARLPNDELVEILSIEGQSAQVRRVEGERAGTLAVCDTGKLQPSPK
jgi:hypothetical protein